MAERGLAIVEFALIVPLLIVLACLVFEGGRALQDQHAVLSMARELGNTAFRQCPDFTDAALMNNCLSEVGTRVLAYANAQGHPLPGAEVVLRLYRHNAAGPLLAGSFQSGAFITRITNQSITGTATEPGLASYNDVKGFILTSEVFFNRTPVLGTAVISHYQTTIY